MGTLEPIDGYAELIWQASLGLTVGCAIAGLAWCLLTAFAYLKDH